MARSFDVVDWKVIEAEFFLRQLKDCGADFVAVRCFSSAFVAAARSITFALQASISGLPQFEGWYKEKQAALKQNKLARFFHEYRCVSQHVGDDPVRAGSGGPGQPWLFWFMPSPDLKEVPEEDLVSAASQYFQTLLELVYECYVRFGPEIDPHQRYTAEHFASLGLTIADAEEEIGFPRGWTDIGDPSAEPYRWQAIRRSVSGCGINDIFNEYLGRTTPLPAALPSWQPSGPRTDGP